MPAETPRLLVILGPTGTGKTRLALALAEALDAEIVGCDALQVYIGFDAGTAKPTPEERVRVTHHLIDCVDPRGDFSLADYVRAAEVAIAQIAARGRIPLVVGGTGLYLRGLLRGVIAAPPRRPELRARLLLMVERHGPERLHRWLAGLDPATAARLHPRDRQRIVRGLELALSGGGLWSERLREQGRWLEEAERFPSTKLGLDLEPEVLRERLNRRADEFFDRGWAAEVRALREAQIPRSANAFKAIGYRELLDALDAGRSPDDVRELVRQQTWRLAKRQRTWFRREANVSWLDAAQPVEALVELAIARWTMEGEAHVRPPGSGRSAPTA